MQSTLAVSKDFPGALRVRTTASSGDPGLTAERPGTLVGMILSASDALTPEISGGDL